MQIGIVSDSHSHAPAVRQAAHVLTSLRVAPIIHCGDICDAATVRLFDGLETHFVFGNMDSTHARPSLRQAMQQGGHVCHEVFGTLVMAGRRLAFTHGDDRRRLDEAVASGDYDYVFYGHSHRQESHREGRTLVLNPGALYRANPRTFALLDLESGAVTVVPV